MSNIIINFMISVIAYYFCRMLDEMGAYLKNFIKEIWNTYFTTYEYFFYMLIFYISLIVFGVFFSL